MINIKAMKTDRRANGLPRKMSAIKLPRADVPPLSLPLIAKPAGLDRGDDQDVNRM